MATEPSGVNSRASGKGETAARERILQILRYSPDISQTFPDFAIAVRHLVPADRISVTLLEADSTYRVILAAGEGPAGFAQGSVLPLRGSLVEWVVTQQVPFVSERPEDSSRFPDLAAITGHGYHSVMAVPLIIQGTSIGTMNLASYQAGVYNQADLARLVPVVQHLSLAVAHFRLAYDLQQRNQQLKGLATLAAAMNESPDLETVCSVAVRKVVEGMQGRIHAVIYLYDEDQQQLVLSAYAGLAEELAALLSRRSADQGISGLVARSGKSIVVADVSTDLLGQSVNPPMLAAGVKSCASIPLKSQGRVLGVMTVGAYRPRQFSLAEIEHLDTIGLYIGTAMQRATAFDEARRARREQQGLVAFVAHELRSPLQSILGFCELLLSGALAEPPLPAAQQECIEVIQQRGRQQLRLIESLLDLARIASGQLVLQQVAVALPELLAELERDYRPRLQERRQTLALALPAGLPPLLADRDQLFRIMDNLVGNAVKYTPLGGAITIAAAQEGEDLVRVTVRDTGPGIKPEQRELVFIPFFRLIQSGAQEIPGSGLGLAIARDLVERQGGKIWLEDAPGDGCCFCFTLPVVNS